MSDLKKYIAIRKKTDKAFAESYLVGNGALVNNRRQT
jgi:hypothetical protein